MLIARGLNKNFQSYKKAPGFKGAVRSFFHREYTIKSAVNNFDLDIGKGEIVALLGPNGAGKTTLMKMFTGIIVPTSGALTINGFQPWNRQKEFRKKIALVMGQKSQLWWDIPAMDSFLLLQRYYEISDNQFKNRIEEMSELLQVKELLHIHVKKLSLGERMKLELMASLLHSPDIIFLDEPTIGLDLVAQDSIREFIKDYHRNHNVTILLTSHYMADVHALCKRLVLIIDGKKSFDGALDKFEKILGHEKSVSFSFAEAQERDNELWRDYGPVWSSENTNLALRIPEEKIRSVSISILQNFPVTDFATEKLPIERVMKTLIERPEILQNA